MVEETQAKQYDYIVIGAGSGGMASGRRAAQFGKKVVMMENRVIGGTCVNVGCVPKKVMFNLANFIEELQVLKGYGVEGTEGVKVNAVIAVLTEDGGTWSLFARAFIPKTSDPKDRAVFVVAGSE